MRNERTGGRRRASRKTEFVRPAWLAAALATMVQLGTAGGAEAGCPGRGMARVGPGCVDKYEASVWRIPPTATALIQAARTGKPTAAELVAGGAKQLGVMEDDYGPCSDDGGTGCESVYAVSTPGVRPSTYLTWFQAQQACGNARKRLPRNAEWQMAAAGTPDTLPDDGATTCVVGGDGVIATGTRSGCVSRWGVFDMSTNVFEWTEDWVPRSTNCTSWGDRSTTYMCLAGAEARLPFPGVIVRGGSWEEGSFGGTLTIDAGYTPFVANSVVGFRCAG